MQFIKAYGSSIEHAISTCVQKLNSKVFDAAFVMAAGYSQISPQTPKIIQDLLGIKHSVGAIVNRIDNDTNPCILVAFLEDSKGFGLLFKDKNSVSLGKKRLNQEDNRQYTNFGSISQSDIEFEGLDDISMNESMMLVGSADCTNFLLKMQKNNLHKKCHVGLVAAFTPFMNGLEHTMWHNSSLITNGICGLAFKQNISAILDYSNFKPISTKTKLIKFRGNVVVDIDGSVKSQLADYLEFNQMVDLFACLNGQFMYKVTSGNPIIGSFSLDTLIDLKEDDEIMV